MRNAPRRILVMGVSGSGKSTVGALLAERLRIPFTDADDLHPPANVAKLAAGTPLTDSDRAPWLLAVAAAWRERGGVLACSALRASYREMLVAGMNPAPNVVFLDVPASVVAERLATRTAHFASPAILPSQFAALEPPPGALVIDGTLDPAAIVDSALAALRSH